MTFITSCSERISATALESPMRSTALLLFLVVSSMAYYINHRSPKLNLPLVGTYGKNIETSHLLEGVEKYPDTPFVLSTSPPLVILPISTLDDFRNLPEDKVSFHKVVQEMFLVKHTGIGNFRPELLRTITFDLPRHIASTTDGLQDEIRYAFDTELGGCKEWTPFPAYSKMLRIVALMSGRVFVGRPLSREEEWIKSSINYTVDCAGARDAVRKYPVWMRGLVAGFLPEIKRIDKYRTRGGELLKPILDAQLAKHGNEKIESDVTGDEQGTFISWILHHTKEEMRRDPHELANNQMALSFASIHTTGMALTQALYDLACRREYIQPLRDEIEQVLTEDGHDMDDNGFLKLKKPSLTKLRKLDSFIKESQRLSPPGYVSHTRVTTSPLALSTGHTIPKGTRIGFPAYAVHTSQQSTTFSPAYNPPSAAPPTEFSGFRFSDLRAMEGKEHMHQFVTTSPESLVFGHGAHACPGRFFASNEMKIVMIEMLRSWDFRLKDDFELLGGSSKRPANIEKDLSCMPNPFAEVEFKRRRE